MRLALFGAHGGTGRVLTQQALDTGHTVTAVRAGVSGLCAVRREAWSK